MRACEGCRRRKIKCDSATTNTWPCSACIRLKLTCVPPQIAYEPDFSSNGQRFEQERAEYESGGSGDDEYQQQVSMQQQQQHHHMAAPNRNIPPIYTHQMPYPDPAGIYHQSGSYGEPASGQSHGSMHYGSIQTPVSALSVNQQPFSHAQPVYAAPPPLQAAHAHSPETYEQDQYGQQNLADLLGELRVNEAGTGMFP